MLGGMSVTSESLTLSNTSPGEDEPRTWARARSMVRALAITSAALPAGRCYAHNLVSIVGGAPPDAAYDLVACGYLLLDDEADVGQGAARFGNLAFVVFASGLLAGKQTVADELGSHHLFDGVEVRLGTCLHKTADQSLVLFGL